MENFDIRKVIWKLSGKRKVLYSKADFQLALAWLIKEIYPHYEIFLDWSHTIGRGKHGYFDIVLKKDENIIPIQLRYKTKELRLNSVSLKNQGARDLACYDYFKDIQTVESLITTPGFKKGYCVFLTNDLGYLNKPNPNAGYREFSIYDGRKIDGECSLNWGESSGPGTRKGRQDPITLKFDYQFKWNVYSDLHSEASNDKFKYLVSEINGIDREKYMKRRFMLAPSGVFVRDMKHLESYGGIDEIIRVMNRVNESDNRAVELIKKEIKKQDDKKVKMALLNILKTLNNH